MTLFAAGHADRTALLVPGIVLLQMGVLLLWNARRVQRANTDLVMCCRLMSYPFRPGVVRAYLLSGVQLFDIRLVGVGMLAAELALVVISCN